MTENLLDVWLKKIGGNFVLLKITVDMCDTLLWVFLERILKLIFEFKKVVKKAYMRVTQHLLHNEIIVNWFGQFLPLLSALGLLEVPYFLVEFQLWHWIVAIILAVVFEEEKSCVEKSDNEGNFRRKSQFKALKVPFFLNKFWWCWGILVLKCSEEEKLMIKG